MEKVKKKLKKPKNSSIYQPALLTRSIPLSIKYIGENIKETLEKQIIFDIEGKCIVEGYVKPGSCRVISYSSGQIEGAYVSYDVIIECLICCPVEGMLIECVVKNITESSGIRAETSDNPSPVVVYIARDHYYKNEDFKKVRVDQTIKVRVIGQRFELNDQYISIIAELVDVKKKRIKQSLIKN